MIKLIAIICLCVSTISFLISLMMISKMMEDEEERRIADEIAKTYSEMKDVKINRGE